jgi:hypothetical protein
MNVNEKMDLVRLWMDNHPRTIDLIVALLSGLAIVLLLLVMFKTTD